MGGRMEAGRHGARRGPAAGVAEPRRICGNRHAVRTGRLSRGASCAQTHLGADRAAAPVSPLSSTMNAVIRAAADLQDFCATHNWSRSWNTSAGRSSRSRCAERRVQRRRTIRSDRRRSPRRSDTPPGGRSRNSKRPSCDGRFCMMRREFQIQSARSDGNAMMKYSGAGRPALSVMDPEIDVTRVVNACGEPGRLARGFLGESS